jgi:hypothetical protein
MMKKLIKLNLKIKYFEGIMENIIDIDMMYMIITAIDQSVYLNIIYKN